MSVWESLSASETEALASAFGSLGINDPRGEAYTVRFEGGSCSTHEGADDAELVVDLDRRSSRQLRRSESLQDLICALFSAVTAKSLSSHWFNQKFLLMLGGVESLIHVNLLDRNGEVCARHSLIFHQGEWLVARDQLLGGARRVFNLTIPDALEYQRQLNKAARANSFSAFKSFAEWYQDWRTGVSSH